MLRKIACGFLLSVSLHSLVLAQATRHFSFSCAFTVQNVPAGQHLRVWFPAAHSDDYQQVKIVSVKGDLPLKRTRESRFGNEIYFAQTSKAKGGDLHFQVVYDVVRHEHLTIGVEHPRLENATLEKKEAQLFLGPDRLVPITGKPADLAVQATAGKESVLDRARAIYDYVFSNMAYDKSGTGWGRGDVLYACDAKKGNCTDFHSLFISMARSQGIPSRFEIGFPLPAGKSSGEIAGYHCWAEFFDPRNGWVPVDISEAWKNPAKKDYFFGAHDANRVQFSIGRDLQLRPPQAGEPLNYFIYPYVELEGKTYEQVSQQFSFADVNQDSQRAAMEER